MYKVLLIGLGKIGLGYDYDLDENYILSHAKAFALHEDFDLLAAIDPDDASRRKFEDKFKNKAYSTIQQALSDNAPDVVVIAVPTQYHLATLQEVLESSHPKLILCEKPLAYNLDDAQEMIALCKQRGVKLIVNYMREFQPSTLGIHGRLTAGGIQTPIRGTVFYTKGFLHNGTHFISLLSVWLGDIVGFEGVSINKILPHNDADVDVTINFENGRVSFISLDENNFSHYSMKLYAQNGCLNYEDGGKKIIWQQAEKSEAIKGYTYLDNEGEELATDMNKSQWYVADEINKMLRSSDIQNDANNLKKLLAPIKIINEMLHATKFDEAGLHT